MLTVSATQFRSNLFGYLDQIANGETIIIRRNNEEVARIVPIQKGDWRDKMTVRPKILVSPEELIKPIEDIWDDYI